MVISLLSRKTVISALRISGLKASSAEWPNEYLSSADAERVVNSASLSC